MALKKHIMIIVGLILCSILGTRVFACEREFICAGMLPEGRGKVCSPGFVPFSPMGRHNVLAIFAKFHGEAPEDSLAPSWAANLFNPRLKGSFSHFYADQSCGALTIRGSVLKKRYSSKYGPKHYLASDPTEEGKYGEFVQEILRAADADVDFSKYDRDGDGYVDFVFIILRTMPRNFIIGPARGICTLNIPVFVTNDPGRGFGGHTCIQDGAVLREGSFSYTVGLMAHEYGHALGLPDLYALNIIDPDVPPEATSAGIGVWGLMGYGALGWHGNDGPNPFCAWSKAKLGWVGINNDRLITITKNRFNLVIKDIGSGGPVYKIPITDTEYFLLVNRQATGSYYDRNIPQSGLLIWHIDEEGKQEDERHKMVDLECADGLFRDAGYPAGAIPDPVNGMDNLDFWANDMNYRNQHYGNMGDATDVFDGERFTAFTPETNPSSIGYHNDPRIAITNIRRLGTDMVVDVRFDFLNHHIVRDTEWSDEIYIDRDVIVSPSATLTIKPGTVVRFAPVDAMHQGLAPDRCELIIQGSLNVPGSFFSPVIFTSAALSPQKGDWYGIHLEGTRVRLNMENAVIQYAKWGINGEKARVTLRNSSIQRNQQDGIDLDQSAISLSGCKLRDNGLAGVRFSGGRIFLQQCVLSNNEWGVWGEKGEIELRSSRIEANRQDGIWLDSWEKKFSITDSQIRGNFSAGIRLKHYSPSAEGVIKGNTVSANSVGIATFSCSPRITENRLEDNHFAIECEGIAVPQVDGFNCFVKNGYSILNLTEQEMSAQNNWWDTTEPSQIASQIQGPVSWNLYLRVDPEHIQEGFLLGQNFPNPFSSVTWFWYQLPLIRSDPQRGYPVVFTIYNILGQPVRRLFEGRVSAGPHRLSWDGRDDEGQEVANGVYIYQLSTEGFAGAGKAILIR